VTAPLFTFDRPLFTERLVLRAFEPGDFDALCDVQSRPEVTRYLLWEPRRPDEVSVSLERKMLGRQLTQEGDSLAVAVTLRSGGPMIGDFTLHYVSEVNQNVEIGYIWHPDVHGQGYATEAGRVLVDLAFSKLRAHRVCARLDARNGPSARLLERLGFRLEAHLLENEWVKGEWTDELIYGLLADEWVAARQ
jgi:RimJ/RimL family protein N-acetyltransferase